MYKFPEIKIIDCPRDAIQGKKEFIPTHKKITHINNLIKSNLFEYIDFGSFVSEKAVPQMQDTEQVIEGINKVNTTKLLAIVVNQRGLLRAQSFRKIDYIGYPFSISETFQQRNANTTIEKSFDNVKEMLAGVSNTNQELVIYISMAFGNPYGDIWNDDILLKWIYKLQLLGVKRFSIADTTGEALPKDVNFLYKFIAYEFPKLDLSIHLHSSRESALEKINAAYEAGCTRFEGAILGYGGCPFAQDDLVGNISTDLLLSKFAVAKEIDINKLKISFFDMIS